MTPRITSTANPHIRRLADLSRRRTRDRDGRFPAEGARIVERALAAGWEIDEVVFAPDLAGDEARTVTITAATAGVEIVEVGEAAFRKIAYRRHPDGVLAVVRTREWDLASLPLASDALVLVAEGTEKPGNLGAMLRIADGAGADAVIAADPATDLGNPNVVRASQGALFSVPVAVGTPEAVAGRLRSLGIRLVAARPGDHPPPWQLDLHGGVALLVGAEHSGLSASWEPAEAVAIPMEGLGDSLNTATAAAVLLYEARRQRG